MEGKQNNVLIILTVAVIITLLLAVWMLFQLNRIEKEITESVLSSIPSLNQQSLTNE